MCQASELSEQIALLHSDDQLTNIHYTTQMSISQQRIIQYISCLG